METGSRSPRLPPPTWKAVIDGKHGGVITELHIPADGDNLASNDGNRFEGLCNLLYVDFKETGKDESGYVAKGTLYYCSTGVKLSVLEEQADRIVIETTGRAGNQVAAQKDVIRFRQRYTFLADRVICDGAIEWLYDDVTPGSRPELIQLDNLFTPGAVDRRDARLGRRYRSGSSAPDQQQRRELSERHRLPVDGGSAVARRTGAAFPQSADARQPGAGPFLL